MTQALSAASVAKNPLIRFTLVKLFRLNEAIPRATATLTEATVPMDTASTTAMLTVVLPTATGLLVDCLGDQALVTL